MGMNLSSPFFIISDVVDMALGKNDGFDDVRSGLQRIV
jgi:hypothetical protein